MDGLSGDEAFLAADVQLTGEVPEIDLFDLGEIEVEVALWDHPQAALGSDALQRVRDLDDLGHAEFDEQLEHVLDEGHWPPGVQPCVVPHDGHRFRERQRSIFLFENLEDEQDVAGDLFRRLCELLGGHAQLQSCRSVQKSLLAKPVLMAQLAGIKLQYKKFLLCQSASEIYSTK